ncbi:MAG TPA: hypothetical protein VHX20_00045 [Terracidiphilus sp.]|nr:hypothetical protein [Terracidiphilus sp.]
MPSAFQVHAADNVAHSRMIDDMDFNAGRILNGELSLDQAAAELMSLIADVASSQPSKTEQLGHREFFLMYKHQDAPTLEAGCRV